MTKTAKVEIRRVFFFTFFLMLFFAMVHTALSFYSGEIIIYKTEEGDLIPLRNGQQISWLKFLDITILSAAVMSVLLGLFSSFVVLRFSNINKGESQQ